MNKSSLCPLIASKVLSLLSTFGVHCRIEIKVCSRQGKQHDGLNVNGKIVARYANTYGNYSSEDCVLFEKQDSDLPVEINPAKRFPLSRCWVSLPTYSSLIVDFNLYEFKTMHKIIDQSVESSVEDGRITSNSILLDDLAIHVHAAWFSPDVVGQRIDSKIGFPSSLLSWYVACLSMLKNSYMIYLACKSIMSYLLGKCLFLFFLVSSNEILSFCSCVFHCLLVELSIYSRLAG